MATSDINTVKGTLRKLNFWEFQFLKNRLTGCMWGIQAQTWTMLHGEQLPCGWLPTGHRSNPVLVEAWVCELVRVLKDAAGGVI